MISRVAGHCFWFGRYLERTESTARILVVTQNLGLDGELTPRQCWHPVVIVSGEEPRFLARFGDSALGDGELVQRYLSWDPENFASLRRSIGAARDNARSIREVVSREVWEVLNELYLWFDGEGAEAQYRSHRYGFYRHIQYVSHLCLGLLDSTMLHDTPLHFILLGALLERAGQTARTLDVHHHALTLMERRNQVIDTSLWLSLLRACSGFEPFMKVHQGLVDGDAVGSFLIFNTKFPRSILHALRSAADRFEEIRPSCDEELPGRGSQEQLRNLETWLAGEEGSFESGRVHDLLTRVVDETAEICMGVGQELLAE